MAAKKNVVKTNFVYAAFSFTDGELEFYDIDSNLKYLAGSDFVIKINLPLSQGHPARTKADAEVTLK